MTHSRQPEEELPQDHWPLPALQEDQHVELAPDDFARIAEDPRYTELRGRFRRFAFPMAAAFLVWYFVYVLLSVYARGLMATPVLGKVNLGTLLGLLQFVTTFAITLLYIRFANRRLDPLAAELSDDYAGGERK